MFLHAALDRFLTQMGNSYSGTKPALPTLNINKVSFRKEAGTAVSGGRVPAQQASQKQQLHLQERRALKPWPLLGLHGACRQSS